MGALIAGCGGSNGDSPDRSTTTIDQDASSPTTVASTIADTEPDSQEPPKDVCALIDPSQLEMVFPEGVPDPTGSEANQGVSCQWGTPTEHLIVTVWPGDEFYSSCDRCEEIALGDAGWIDGSASFWTALIVTGETTVQLIATGLGMEEDAFIDLTSNVVEDI